MIKRLRTFIPLILLSGATWSVSIILFFFYRYWEDYGIDTFRISRDFPLEQYPLLRISLEAFLFGMISEVVNILVFKPYLKLLPSPIAAILRIAGHLLLFLVYVSLSLLTRNYINFQNTDGALTPLMEIWQNGYIFELVLFFSFIIIVMSIFRQLYHMIGPLNLSSFIMGRYKVPRKEERIFLFLDLNSSTSLAERLGDEKFSRMLQDCFTDLSDLSYGLRAQTYQYVGDEAVFTWSTRTGFKHQRCLKLFFRFKKRLKKNERHYIKKYGLAPTFKAAMHCGSIIGVEVGEVKTEIAYHGDAINTASRILDKCHELGEEFLVSGDIVNALPSPHKYKYVDRGSAHLKGKFTELHLYGVHKRKD